MMFSPPLSRNSSLKVLSPAGLPICLVTVFFFFFQTASLRVVVACSCSPSPLSSFRESQGVNLPPAQLEPRQSFTDVLTCDLCIFLFVVFAFPLKLPLPLFQCKTLLILFAVPSRLFPAEVNGFLVPFFSKSERDSFWSVHSDFQTFFSPFDFASRLNPQLPQSHSIREYARHLCLGVLLCRTPLGFPSPIILFSFFICVRSFPPFLNSPPFTFLLAIRSLRLRPPFPL